MSEEINKKPPYTFTQTLNDISVNIPLDRKVKGSDLQVKITKTTISVKYDLLIIEIAQTLICKV